jgi:hypothetical protein
LTGESRNSGAYSRKIGDDVDTRARTN